MTGMELAIFLAIKAALAKAAVIGVLVVTVTIVELVLERITTWMKSKRQLKMSDKSNLAFSIMEKLANGQFTTVYGIFNTDKEEILDGEQVFSEKVASDLAELHNKKLVVYS